MNIVERAKNILLTPKTEWPVIAAEPHTVQGLYTQYIMIFAAIGPIASFIGLSLVGMGGFGVNYRVPLGAGIAYAVLAYIMSLGSVYVMALIIDALAPTFGGQKDFMAALKVTAFGWTAAWLAGIFSIIPAMSVLGILGLYSLYLLFLGLPVLMKSSPDKTVPYLVVVLVVAIVLSVVIGAIASLVIPSPVRGF